MNKCVATEYHTLSYHIDVHGVFTIQGVGYKNGGVNMPVTVDVATKFVHGILQNPQRIKRIAASKFASHVIHILSKLKKAVAAIEEAALDPHTRMGRKRLMREFELIIADDC